MKDIEDAKKLYDEIPIPDELSARVQQAIDLSAKKRENEAKIIRLAHRKRMARRSVSTAAAILAAFTVVVNTNTTYADSLRDVPVIGSLAQVLTFRSYETNEDNLKVSVEIPTIDMIAADTNGITDSVNEEILKLCEEYAAAAKQDAAEYKKAFMETGGTEEEWAAHDLAVRVWYEIHSQTDNYISLSVMGTENWSSAALETKSYSIDLSSGELATLKDLLGDDYIALANEQIQAQMETKAAESGIEFFDDFEGISENQKFYVNSDGNPVIVFDKYEIAPGAAGIIEFEIKK